MQCDDVEVEMPVAPKLTELDSALHELGMLSSCTNSRQEYLSEKRQILNMLRMNSRYVSNVSIGFRVRPVLPLVRYQPYKWEARRREERHRTKSENNDNVETTSIVKAVLDETMDIMAEEVSQLKKAKSLESIILENNKEIDLNSYFKLPEVEIVSDCIEKLKVDE